VSELDLDRRSSLASPSVLPDAIGLAANRWTLWRTLARGFSHSLANATQLLALEPFPAGARAEAHERLVQAHARLGALHRPGDGGPVRLPDVLAELDACQGMQIGWPATTLEIDAGPLPALDADAGDLLHALLALVTNAKEASGAERAGLRITAAESADGIVACVEDRGPGFSPEARRRAFEPGAAPRDAEHAGLGLWAARTLLRRRGGDVELGEGAAVRLWLRSWRRRSA